MQVVIVLEVVVEEVDVGLVVVEEEVGLVDVVVVEEEQERGWCSTQLNSLKASNLQPPSNYMHK